MRMRPTIVIVGGGCVAWTIAAVLKRTMGNGCRVVVLEIAGDKVASPEIQTAMPSALALLRYLDISERELIKSTRSSFSLANRYRGWGAHRSRGSVHDYFMPYGEHGFILQGLEFPAYVMRHHSLGENAAYDAYSLSATAARLGRFCHPSPLDRSMFSTLTYGLVLDTLAYSDYLKNFSVMLGAEYLQVKSLTGILHTETGEIDSLLINQFCAEGEASTIVADLYIDCSGYPGILMDDTLQADYLSYAEYFGVNGVSRLLLRRGGSSIPSVDISARPFGWERRLSTQDKILLEYHFNRDQVDDAVIRKELHESAEGAHVINASTHSFSVGRRSAYWYKNCVSMGASAGNLECFLSGELDMAQSAIFRLLDLLPGENARQEVLAGEYNRLADLEFEHITDFNSLHYNIGATYTTEFWQSCGRIKKQTGMEEKMRLFLCSGKIPDYEGDILTKNSWLSLLLGHEIWPQAYDPLVDQVSARWSKEQLHRIRSVIGSAANSMPSLQTYLADYQSQ